MIIERALTANGILTTLALAYGALIASAGGQELAPDDPAIVEHLSAWFRDAESSFDPETGIWSDSSGNERHAAPVGEINVGGPVTYLAPTLATVSGGAFSDDLLPSVHFASDVDDLLQASDLNGGTGLTDLTIFAVYHVNLLAANPNLTRALGFGSIAALQTNPGNHFNLACDPSIRKDNGQLGAGTYTGPFPAETTFIRSARMSVTSVDEWFNIDGTPEKVLNIEGSSYATSSDDFFFGDLRVGATVVPGLPAAPAVADIDIVQTIVYTSALSDEQVVGVNEWLGSHLTGGSGGAPLAFTEIIVGADQRSVTLTWNSKPGKVYALDLSYDMQADWQELEDSLDSEGGETTSTTVPTFAGVEPAPCRGGSTTVSGNLRSSAPNASSSPPPMPKTTHLAILAIASQLICASTSRAAELRPDAPSIADSLVLWLHDADINYDAGAGQWNDSSGRGNDARGIGTVGAVEWSTPIAATTPGGELTDSELACVRFGGNRRHPCCFRSQRRRWSSEPTIIAAYSSSDGANLTRAVGFGSIAAIQANPGNHFNLASDPSIRKDNGQLGAGSYSEAFPVGITFIRSARMSPASVDEWFNVDGSMDPVFSNAGGSFTTSTDRFYLGDLRAGATPVPGFGASLSTATIDIVELIVYSRR